MNLSAADEDSSVSKKHSKKNNSEGSSKKITRNRSNSSNTKPNKPSGIIKRFSKTFSANVVGGGGGGGEYDNKNEGSIDETEGNDDGIAMDETASDSAATITTPETSSSSLSTATTPVLIPPPYRSTDDTASSGPPTPTSVPLSPKTINTDNNIGGDFALMMEEGGEEGPPFATYTSIITLFLNMQREFSERVYKTESMQTALFHMMSEFTKALEKLSTSSQQQQPNRSSTQVLIAPPDSPQSIIYSHQSSNNNNNNNNNIDNGNTKAVLTTLKSENKALKVQLETAQTSLNSLQTATEALGCQIENWKGVVVALHEKELRLWKDRNEEKANQIIYLTQQLMDAKSRLQTASQERNVLLQNQFKSLNSHSTTTSTQMVSKGDGGPSAQSFVSSTSGVLAVQQMTKLQKTGIQSPVIGSVWDCLNGPK